LKSFYNTELALLSAAGNTGASGFTGRVGLKGDTGERGATGATGLSGINGLPGNLPVVHSISKRQTCSDQGPRGKFAACVNCVSTLFGAATCSCPRRCTVVHGLTGLWIRPTAPKVGILSLDLVLGLVVSGLAWATVLTRKFSETEYSVVAVIAPACASEVTTVWRYRNVTIIIIINHSYSLTFGIQ